MGHLEIHSAAAGLGDHRGESLCLQIVDRVVRLVSAGQMGHDAADADGFIGSRAA